MLGIGIPDTIYGMNRLVFSMKYNKNNNCIKLSMNSGNNNVKDATGCDVPGVIYYSTMVSNASIVWILNNISDFICKNNSNNDNNNIRLTRILYDYNKMNLIFYYYVKIYFDIYISSIWSWILVNVFYVLFGVFECVFLGEISLCNMVLSVCHSYLDKF